MASVGETGGGRKKTLNPEVNLVPFIDLLSVCICFLLVSAVWLQIGTVQVKQALGTQALVDAKDQFDLTVKFITPFASHIEMQQKGVTVAAWDVKADSKETFTAEFGRLLDAKVLALSQAAKTATPFEAKDLFASATIVPAQNVPYKSLILAMDALRKRQVVNLAVMPKAG
jgi:biopolymer transport protein TolR